MVASCFVVSILIASVFFAVPRGVTVGSIRFVPHNWHKKSDHGTYTLQLGVSMPVYNNNWYPVRGHDIDANTLAKHPIVELSGLVELAD